MRASGFVILVAALLVAVVTGCGGVHRYDGRLTATDSLMWDAPDSALTIVSAIDMLRGEADRAYRDLLLTQARYKAYQEITTSDDSAITRAMDYYRVHSGDREKLTRAYLYKGAVMEELGHVDSAMYYYKTAEASADPNDYSNLGQINTRIAYLYRISFADEQTCFDKYQLAYQYYVKSGNKELQLNSLYSLFMINGITHQQNHEKLYDTAIALARDQHDDHMLFDLYELRCRQLSRVDSTCPQAKQIALNCYYGFDQYTNNDLLLDLAYLYTIENKLDSAKYFIGIVDESLNPDDEERLGVRKYEVLSMIAVREGNELIAEKSLSRGAQLTDSILNNKLKYQIQQIENDKNHAQAELRQQTIHGLRWLLRGIIALAVIALMALVFYHYRRVHRIKAIIEELKHTSINKHESLVQQDPQNREISEFIGSLVAFMQTSIDSSQHDAPSVIRKRVKEGIENIAASEDFWKALKTHIDQNYDGLITRLAQNPRITENDLKFIELCCCGFDYLEIAIVMDYTPKYISQKRKDVARKLHLRIPLQEYLDEAMKRPKA